MFNPSLYSRLILGLNQSGLMGSSNGPSVKPHLLFRSLPQFSVLHLGYSVKHSTLHSCSKIQAMHVIKKMNVLLIFTETVFKDTNSALKKCLKVKTHLNILESVFTPFLNPLTMCCIMSLFIYTVTVFPELLYFLFITISNETYDNES